MRTPRRRLAAALTLSTALLAAPAAGLLIAPPASAAVGDIKINEIATSGTDFIEIINTGTTSVDASGLFLMDNQARTQRVPAATTLAPNQIAAFPTDFGLGDADSARLFASDGVTQLDSYTWLTAPAATFGRCPDGTGPIGATGGRTQGQANNCPAPVSAATWPGAATVTTVDQAGFLGGNISGLTYEGTGAATRGTLWAVKNDPGTLYKMKWDGSQWIADPTGGWSAGKVLHYPNGLGNPDSEGVTITSAGAAGGIYVSTERDGSGTSKLAVLRFDPSGAGPLSATNEWNVSTQIPPTSDNGGLEAIGWVPDSYLTGRGFLDATTAAAYTPATYPGHGSGIFLVGVEDTGRIYGFVLQDNGTATKVADFKTDLAAVMDLHFDASTQQVWGACDNTCGGNIARMEVATSGPSTGTFTATSYVARPAGLPDYNNEGFTISPAASCVSGQRPVWWADDSNDGGHSLREGTLTCSADGGGGLPAPTDTTAPAVNIGGVKAGETYFGTAPAATCAATDAGSGVASCTLTSATSGSKQTVTATATDKAGNKATTSVSFTVVTTFVKGAAYKNGAFAVKRGKKFTIVTYVASGKPKLSAVVAKGTKPSGKGPKLKPAGTAGALTIYQAKVLAPKKLGGKSWVIAVKIGSTTIKVKLKPTGR